MTTEHAPGPFFAELLQAHAHIEVRLKVLELAAEALGQPGGAPAALQSMADTLEFFASFGAKHNEDEERTLFPRLKQLPDFEPMLAAFDFQHKLMDTELKALAARAVGFAPGREKPLAELAHRYVEVQRSHMLAEERALFPLAESKLPRQAMAAMFEELRARIA